jgi:hypothetical protein
MVVESEIMGVTCQEYLSNARFKISGADQDRKIREIP